MTLTLDGYGYENANECTPPPIDSFESRAAHVPTAYVGVHAQYQRVQHWKGSHISIMNHSESLIRRPEAVALVGASQERFNDLPVDSDSQLQSSAEQKQRKHRVLEIISNCDALECMNFEPACSSMHLMNKACGKTFLKTALRPSPCTGGRKARRSRFGFKYYVYNHSLSFLLIFLFMIGASSAFFAANRPQSAYSFSSCHWYCSPTQCIDDCNVGGYPVIKLNSRYGWLPLNFVINNNDWVVLDLGIISLVCGVITMGREYPPGQDTWWVTSYVVSASTDNITFTTLGTYPGNSDSTTAATTIVSPSFARYVKISPVTWNNAIAMRMDVVVGAKNPTSEATGSFYISEPIVSDTAILSFSFNRFQASFPGSGPYLGLVTLKFPPLFLSSSGALSADIVDGGTGGCGAGCSWSLGLYATFYGSSSGLLNSDVTSGLTGGDRINSVCTLIPHPSIAAEISNHAFFKGCLATKPANAVGAVDRFVMRMAGFINIPSAGTWTFFLTSSDDGSRLWIGNTCVVDNNNFGPTHKDGMYVFERGGWHAITVELSQNNGSVGVIVSWQQDIVVAKGIIPASRFAPSLNFTTTMTLAFFGGSSVINAPSVITLTMSGVKFATSPVAISVTVQTPFDTIASEPIRVVSLGCSVSARTALHCMGTFNLGASQVPMLYMTEGSFAWVAVKYTSDTGIAIVQDKWSSKSKNFYVSNSILASSIIVASDILMVESSSSVYANMSTTTAFSKVRENILGGCYWFKDTYSVGNLSEWMSPYAKGMQIPDAKTTSAECNGLEYKCCTESTCVGTSRYGGCLPQYGCNAGVFWSCNDDRGSCTVLHQHYRLRAVDQGQSNFNDSKTHSIWFRIPLTHLLSASLPPPSIPVGQGLIAMYAADSWRPAELPAAASWLDLSGAGNHVTEIGGSISVARPVAAPAYVYGDSTAWMRFPVGILPSTAYTLFFVARYNGPVRGRIFQGGTAGSSNWLSGFHRGRSGVAYHGCWITDGSLLTQEIDVHGSDWVIGSDRISSFRSNGKERATKGVSGCSFVRLHINNMGGGHDNGQDLSDFAVQSILVYNRLLSVSDVQKVEAWLTAAQSPFTPTNLQGVVGFYDARDLTSCIDTCSWIPRAGFIGPLIGTAIISGDGWITNPRMATAKNTKITGSQAYTSIVGFKLSAGGDSALRTLLQIGSPAQCRTQQLSAAGLRFSGCINAPEEIGITSVQQTDSSHVWAVMHDGGTSTRSYWNGAYFIQTTPSTWNTSDGPLFVGRSAVGISDQVLPGGVRYVLLLNRALTQSEVAAVARWSWDSHGVGLDLMNFSPDAWTGVSAGQVYWTPPAHMQPLSSRTVRFLVNIVNASSSWRSIVRFGSSDSDVPPFIDRMLSVWITPNVKQLYLAMTKSIKDNEIAFFCNTDIDGPTFVTIVYTQSSMFTFINSVKQTHASCSVASLPSTIADTDLTRKARHSKFWLGVSVDEYTLRSLQVLDYAMSDVEAQAPVIISVTPRLLLASDSFVTVIGSPFVAGAPCSALFHDGFTSTSCSAVSAVEIIVSMNSTARSVRPALMVSLSHNGMTFRSAPLSLYEGSDLFLTLSTYVANTPAVTLTMSFKVAAALSSHSFKLISVNGLRFKGSETEVPAATCSNLNPSNVSISASLIPSRGVLVLKLATAVIPALPTAAIICTIAGFILAEASSRTLLVDASFPSSTSMFFEIPEGQLMTLRAPSIHTVFESVIFASYGTPERTESGFIINPTCHLNISASVQNALIGYSEGKITCSTQTFGVNPCTPVKRCAIHVSIRCRERYLEYPRCFSEVSLFTLDSGGRPLQMQGGTEFPAVFHYAGSGGSLSLTSHMQNAIGVVMTLSLVVTPAFFSTAFKLISLSGLRFSHLNATGASASCSNLSPPTTISSVFTPSLGVLLLNLSAAATPAVPMAAVVCKVAGFANAAASPSLSGGNGFIQIGSWRFGMAWDNGRHFSFSHINGKAPLVLRCDGLYTSGDSSTNEGHSRLPITWSLSLLEFLNSPKIPNITVGTSWIEFGSNIRLGTLDNTHLTVSFRACDLTFNNLGRTAVIWRSDGSTRTGVQCGYSPCSLPETYSTFQQDFTFATRFEFDSDSLHIGNFRIGLFNGTDFSISHSFTGKVSTIFRPDSTEHRRPMNSWIMFPNTDSFFPESKFDSGAADLSTFDARGWPLQTQRVVFPEIVQPRIVTSVSPLAHLSTAQMTVSVYGMNSGLLDWSGRLRLGFTASSSTQWTSAHTIICRIPHGLGSGLSVTASVLLNSGSLTGVLSYSRFVFNVTFPDVLLHLTGSVLVTAVGMNFGSFNPSESSKISRTASQASFWKSSSSIVVKASGTFSLLEHVALVITVEQQKSDSQRLSPLLLFQNAYAVNGAKYSNTPSTGAAHVFIFGQNFGGAIFSAKHRFTGTAMQATWWWSDSCIKLRTPAGVVVVAPTLLVSFPGQFSTKLGVLISALSYDTPSPSSVTSGLLRNISITGSNFGPYLAVVPSSTSCETALVLPPNTVSFLCNSSGLDTQSTGITVTEVAVDIRFVDPMRLDDVVVSLVSPQNKEYKLMQNKCYGALPCSEDRSVSFFFQILPIVQLQSVPLMLCATSGRYLPDDVAALRLAFLSQSAMGVWSLRVSTGSQAKTISTASIFFKTANLEFRIANVPVTSLVWFSDSRLSMNAPGFLDDQGFESSSGFGRNRVVSVLSSGITSPTSCAFDYPAPVITRIGDVSHLTASGSTRMELLGRYFSNMNSNPRARAGFSPCTATRWLSDTALSCTLSPWLGSSRSFFVTVESSADARFNSSFAWFPSRNVLGDVTLISAATGTSLAVVNGAGMGVWDSSVRVRHAHGISAAAATLWLCDSRISARMHPFIASGPGFLISLNYIVNNASLYKGTQRYSSTLSAHAAANIPTTGSSFLRVFGTGFGLYLTSFRMTLGGSCCLESRWASHSSVSCKSASGHSSRLNSLVFVATTSAAVVIRNGLAVLFDAPSINESANVFSNNSLDCFSYSLGCADSYVVQLAHASCGFGTFVLPRRQLTFVQGSRMMQCDNSSWISDSSVECLLTAKVSPEFRFLQVLIEPVPSQAVTVFNPFYIPAPPLMSNQTVQFRFFQRLLYPQGEDRGYREFGTTSGFEWLDSSLAATVDYSRVVTVSFLLFLRASQYFMDSKFEPIETLISGSLTVWSTIDVTSVVLCDQAPFKNVSFVLGPRLFWAKTTISLAFCTPNDLNKESVSLNVKVYVRNSNSNLSAVAVSPSFLIMSSGTSSVKVTRHPPAKVRAASIFNDALGFRFNYGTKLDEVCEQGGLGLLKFSVVLVCAGQVSHFRSVLSSDGGFIESVQCIHNISGIMFTRPSPSCQFNVSVLTDRIVFQLSSEFEVVPGSAEVVALLGAGPFCTSAGAIVWSMSTYTDGPCLVAQLQDAEGNNVSSAVDATVVARSVNSLVPDYQVARNITSTSSLLGLIRWCGAYSSRTQSSGVVFGARVNGNITYWTSSVINVSSAGPPYNLLPGSTAISNETVVPGVPFPKLSFAIEDAGGNLLAGSAIVAIRVRIVPRLNSTIGRSAASMAAFQRKKARRLLQLLSASSSSCDLDIPLEFMFIQSPKSPNIIAGPDFFCRAGVNDIFFDVGTYSTDLFSPTVSNSFKMSVKVSPGQVKFFFLVNFDGIFAARSYRLIDFLEIMFLDVGLNEVSGSATMSVASFNATVGVYPSHEFNVVSNSTSKAFVPPFFLHVADWIPSETPFWIGLSVVNSSVPQYGKTILALQLNRSCEIGHRYAYSSHADLYSALKMSMGFTNTSAFAAPPAICAKCISGTISDRYDAETCRPCSPGTIPNQWSTRCIPCVGNYYKSNFVDDVCTACPPRSFSSSNRVTCYTFDFVNPPTRIHPHKSFFISGISLRDAIGSGNVSSVSSMKVLLMLAKKNILEQSSAVLSVNLTCNVSLWYFPPIKLPMILEPSSDFIWSLKMVDPPITDVVVTFEDIAVSVLDISPIINALSSSDLPINGGNLSVDCAPSDPSVSFFLPLFTVANVTNASCVFLPSSHSMVAFSQPAEISFVSRSRITLRCTTLVSGRLGPPFSVWRLRAVFPDGRESPSSAETLTVYCPAGMYIESNVTETCMRPPCCLFCPSPMSASLVMNSFGIQKCVCRLGYYGSGGQLCMPCPRNAKYGFVCAAVGMLLPLVKPGYYIDYTLLSECSEESCKAVIKCQNERACPGGSSCLSDENECYDSSSFGCVKCCKSFYIENFVCRRCPSAQLPLLFGLTLLALIMFIGVSSSIDFPPILSIVSGMKVFMKGMQAFAGIRLFKITWPSIVLQMFDFTRFFSFSIDVLRPECTFSYNEDTKLASILIGPFACVAFVAIIMMAYVTFKCRRITRSLQHPTLQQLLAWTYQRTFKSTWACIICSSLCLKFTAARMMRHGVLWHALNPTLVERSDTLVLNQKVRRGALAAGAADVLGSRKHDRLPRDWAAFRSAVVSFEFLDDFNSTTKRFRMMLSSAMSIFIFTFQGSMEAALSTFDCSDGVLRKVPTVRCDLGDSLYGRLLTISVIGIIIYCVFLPSCVALVLRSRWCREVFIHENVAYNQLVGFLTSLYNKNFQLWELVICVTKIVLISIPLFVSKNPVVQSLSTFTFMLIYLFFVMYLKPMQSTYLNKVEILSCISVVVGSFTSVFFVVELDGSPLLSGSAKDLVGLVFVIICSVAFCLSAKYIYENFSQLLLLYSISFAKSWILDINTRLGTAGSEGAYIPLVATLYNKVASGDILKLKRKMRTDVTEHEQRENARSGCISRTWGSFSSWMLQKRLSYRSRQYKPPPDLLDQCMKEPELEALAYLQKMGERVATWEQVAWKYWDVDKKCLPAEFREVKGDVDPPHAEYAYQANVIHMLEDTLPPSVHRVLTSLMFSHLMMMARTDLTPAERQYNDRMQEKLQEYAASMGSISQIYFHILNTERRRLNALPFWRRLLTRKAPRKDIFLQALSRMSDLDIAKVTQDALGYSLPQFQQQTRRRESVLPKHAGDDSTTQGNFSKAAATTANNLTTLTVDARDSSPANDKWVITSMSTDVGAYPGADAAEPSRPQKAPLNLGPAETSGLLVNLNSNALGSQQLQPREPAAELEFELHEVVVHSKETDRGHYQCAQHQRAFGSGDDCVASALHKRSVNSVAAKFVKMLAPPGREDDIARSSVSAVRLPAQTARIEAIDTGAKGQSQNSPKLIPLLSDASGSTSIPQPPPRSRSRSRNRQPSSGNTAVSDILKQQSLVSAISSIQSVAGHVQAFEVPPLPPHDVKVPSSSAFANPREQNVSSFRTRNRGNAAIGAVSADHATGIVSAEPSSSQLFTVFVPASRAKGGVAESSLSARDTQQNKTATAHSGRRQAMSAASKRQSAPDRAANASWDERVKTSKEKFGDRVEEC